MMKTISDTGFTLFMALERGSRLTSSRFRCCSSEQLISFHRLQIYSIDCVILSICAFVKHGVCKEASEFLLVTVTLVLGSHQAIFDVDSCTHTKH